MAARSSRKKKATRKKATARKPRQPKAPRATRSRKKTPRGEKDPGGRPAIDWTPVIPVIADLAEIGNTVEDMARILKVGKSTLEEAIANVPEVREAYYAGGAELNSDLRRSQVKFAKRGSAPLLKWLGIQRLGQRDVKAVEFSGTGDDGALKIEGDLGPVVARKIVEFLRSRGKK